MCFSQLLRTTCGTPNYVAPEVLANKGYDGKKADVWSMGVILFVLLAGYLPFEEATMVALFKKIKNADFTYPSWFSADVRALLDRILVPDPDKRITLAELRACEWLNRDSPVPDGVVPIPPSPALPAGGKTLPSATAPPVSASVSASSVPSLSSSTSPVIVCARRAWICSLPRLRSALIPIRKFESRS